MTLSRKFSVTQFSVRVNTSSLNYLHIQLLSRKISMKEIVEIIMEIRKNVKITLHTQLSSPISLLANVHLPLRYRSVTWINAQPCPSTSTVYWPGTFVSSERWTSKRLSLLTLKISLESSLIKVTVCSPLEKVKFT